MEVEWGVAFLVMLRLHPGLGVSNLAMICTNPTPFFVATQWAHFISIRNVHHVLQNISVYRQVLENHAAERAESFPL